MMYYLTEQIPGIGGQIKTQPADFFVEEIPLYLPCGEGQHLYITIEKEGFSTHEAIRRIARTLNIPRQNIGYAGLKDALAITRQTLSLDGVSEADAAALNEMPNIKILEMKPHRNKLKIGHLTGNRFQIRVRGVDESAQETTEKILTILATKGIPNYFGEQRFGMRDNTHRLGETLVRDDKAGFVAEYLGLPRPHETPNIQAARQLVDEGQWAEALAIWPHNLSDERRVLADIVKKEGRFDGVFKALHPKMRGFFLSAFQSHLFNQLLSARLPDIDRLQTGDVAYLHRNGAAFVVTDAETEQPRADAFELSPSGPLFGPRTLMPEGEPGRQEQAILADYGLTPDDFKLSGVKLKGSRRAYRFQLENHKVWWDDGLMVSFELTSGAYATTVMAEVMKPASD